VLIFVDDYFNCLTVGSVMQPVTDKFKVSRAKLSYIIDATAAPVCIIAPISSWAAAVTSSVSGEDVDGFSLFLQTIPYNFYALLTILFMVALTLMRFEYGPMKKYERMADAGDLFGGTGDEYGASEEQPGSKGKVFDLVLPVLVLIAACILSMVYTGGFFSGTGFIEAFAASDASVGLPLGSLIALLFTFLLYIPRRVITFRQFTDSLPEGFRAMVPAILILCFAWTLGGFCSDYLGAGEFVGGVLAGNTAASAFIPGILFLIALGLAFATGTSWGTFAILIPIAQSIFPGEMSTILVISISAVLAGAVCGDHCSPISDTTIMSSTGARVNHIIHVSSQMPYALTVAGLSFVCYVIAGFVQNAWIVLPIGIVLTLGTLFVIRQFAGKTAETGR
jgi:Na+/H+ antiporter NhaC